MPTDKTSKTLKTLAWLITVFASIVLLQVSYFALKDLPRTNVPNQPAVPMKAVITEIVSREDTPYSLDGSSEMSELTITFNARLLDGYRKGETVTAIQSIDGFLPAGSQHEVEKGSRVILLEGYDPTSSYGYTFGDFLRTDILFWLLMAFFIALLIFGHFKGLNTIISLTLTCAAIFMVFIPSILTHQNIYIYSTLTCLYIIIMTLLIVNGYNRKTFVAIAGCFSGVLIAGVLTLIFTNILHTSGVMDDKSLYLANLGSGELDLKGIVFAGIIIGAVGAIMDVAMSLAASLHELCLKVEKPTFKLLMTSGITIGRDMMGTMANTLVLAYIGSSLSMVVLLSAYNDNLLQVLNREMIVTEILQGLVGSIGILLTIPLTSFLAAAIFPAMKKSHHQMELTDNAVILPEVDPKNNENDNSL